MFGVRGPMIDVDVSVRRVACVRTSGRVLFGSLALSMGGKRGVTLVKGGNSNGSALLRVVTK